MPERIGAGYGWSDVRRIRMLQWKVSQDGSRTEECRRRRKRAARVRRGEPRTTQVGGLSDAGWVRMEYAGGSG
eukprot:scaffold9460_cov49-Phaeocystis_antarctica.AAC.2